MIVLSDGINDTDSVPEPLETAIGGKNGYDDLNKIGDLEAEGNGQFDGELLHTSVTGLDVPLIHLAGVGGLSDEEKLEATGRIETGEYTQTRKSIS